MEIITKNLKSSYSLPKALNDFSTKNNFVIFDIETTGLSSNYNKVILIGILYFKNDNVVVEQFFAENSQDEKKLLSSFAKKLKEFNTYITYNGHSFDIPFLNKRFKKNKINYEIDPHMNIDIYRIVRKYKERLGLSNCKLKTVEKLLGITRDDTISGKESVDLYKAFEQTKNNDLKNKILLHNYEDIVYLLPTSNILNYLSINQLFCFLPYEITIDKGSSLKLRIQEYKIIKDFLEVKGSFLGSLQQDFISYNQSYSYAMLRENNEFSLRLPVLNIKLPNNEACSYVNIDEIDLINGSLGELDHDKRNMYLIKLNNDLNYINIYNTTKELLST